MCVQFVQGVQCVQGVQVKSVTRGPKKKNKILGGVNFQHFGFSFWPIKCF